MNLFKKRTAVATIEATPKTREHLLRELAGLSEHEAQERARLDIEAAEAEPALEAAQAAWRAAAQTVDAVRNRRQSLSALSEKQRADLQRQLRESAPPRLKEAHEIAVEASREACGHVPMNAEAIDLPTSAEGLRLVRMAPARIEGMMFRPLTDSQIEDELKAIEDEIGAAQ